MSHTRQPLSLTGMDPTTSTNFPASARIEPGFTDLCCARQCAPSVSSPTTTSEHLDRLFDVLKGESVVERGLDQVILHSCHVIVVIEHDEF